MKQHNIIKYNVKLHPGGGRGGDRGEGIKRRRGGNKGGWIFFFSQKLKKENLENI